MSETATQLDAAKSLADWTRRVSRMYCQDLKAISQEAYETSMGGVARTAHDFTTEVAGMNHMIAAMLRGEAPGGQSDEEKAAFSALTSTIQGGCDAITASGNAMADAIEAAGPRLAEVTRAPWGEEMTFFTFALLAANHIMYHDGQLTMLQSYHGDGEMHWFDE